MVRFTWIVPSYATTIVRVCLLLIAGGFAAQHSRVPVSSDLCEVLFAASVALFFIRRVRWFACFLLGFTLFLQSGLGIIGARLEPQFSGDSILAEVRVVDFPEIDGATVSLLIEPVADARLPARSRVTWFEPTTVPGIGDVWQLELRLRRPRGSSNPGGFSLENWMFRERIHASGYVVSGKRNQFLRDGELSAINTWRRDFVIRLQAGSGNAAPVLAAIGTGTRHLLSREQWDQYAKTGTSHLMAISGLHIGLAAAAAFVSLLLLCGVARFPGNGLDVATVGSVAAATVYALFSGFAVPSQRAIWMLILGAMTLLGRRRARPDRILAIAAMAVFVSDPVSIMAPGFSLSFCAVAALLWFGRQYSRPVAGRLLWQLAGMQLALLFGLMPLTILLFQRTALVAPLANMLVVPLFSFVTVPLTLFSMLVSPLWNGAANALLWIAAGSVALAERCIATLARQSVADTPVAGVDGFSGPVGLFVLLPALWLILPRGWPGRWLALLGVAALLLHKPASPPSDCVDAHFLDVGQGLAVVVQSKAHVLVFDTGASYRSGGSAAEKTLIPFLRYRAIDTIDWLVISHADDDHAGGVAALVANMSIDTILAGEPLPDLQRDSFACSAGQRWAVDGIVFEILHPASGSARTGNDASCVLLIQVGEHRMLLSGDIEAQGERQFLSRWPYDTASVVLIPHHGSLTSSSPAFVNQLRPDIAVAAAGYGNRWGFPKDAVIRRWQRAGAIVLDTASSGAVSLRVCREGGISQLRRARQRKARFWHDAVQL
jgi:competence protein ComEC